MRAQTSYIFIFILVVVLMGVIVLFGYQAISKLTSSAETVATSQLEKDLRSEFESIRRLRDSEKVFEARVPGAITQVCFAKTYPTATNWNINSNEKFKGIEAYEGSGESVFLLEQDTVVSALNVGATAIKGGQTNSGNYKVSSTYLCQTITSKLSIRLIGKGDHVEVAIP